MSNLLFQLCWSKWCVNEHQPQHCCLTRLQYHHYPHWLDWCGCCSDFTFFAAITLSVCVITNINTAPGLVNCWLWTLHILSVELRVLLFRGSQPCTIPNQIELKYSLMIKDCKEMFPSRSKVTSRLVSCLCPPALITVIHQKLFAGI